MIFANLAGWEVLQTVAGQDASKQFRKYHRLPILDKFQDRLLVGTLENDIPITPWKSLRSIFRRG